MNENEKKLVYEVEQVILMNKNVPGGMKVIRERMNEVYRYFKTVVTEASFDDERLLEVFRLERLMKNDFLPLNSEPIFNPDQPPVVPKFINDEEDCKAVMDFIVHQTRKHLNEYHDIRNATLEKLCIDTSFDVKKICDSLGVTQTHFGCSEDLSPGMFHHFNIAKFALPTGETKAYLIDCTYRQFFTYSESFLERIGLPLNSGPNIGSYMIMDERRKAVAEELLTKGYIEYTPENIKNYFDGFVFSGRNGFYYEQLGKSVLAPGDYEPDYTYEDYMRALDNGGLTSEPHIGTQIGIMNNVITFDNGDTLTNRNYKQ